VLAAGGSPGTTDVTGDVDFDPGSRLEIQLAGLTDTDAHRSRLLLTGALTFAGSIPNPFTIEVTKSGSFAGGSLVSYTIAQAGSIGSAGLNSALNLPIGPGGTGSALNISFIRLIASGFSEGDALSLQRVGNDLKLFFDPINVPGDFDSDGDVDGADFVAWQTNFPTASGATLAGGDADGDGDVDGADFVVWQTNFPYTPGPGASPVPEPNGLAFCVMLALAFAIATRRRQIC
jgi:hypothetical protein